MAGECVIIIPYFAPAFTFHCSGKKISRIHKSEVSINMKKEKRDGSVLGFILNRGFQGLGPVATAL